MNLHEWTKQDLYARVLELEAELDSVRFERDSARYMRDVYRAEVEKVTQRDQMFPLPPGEEKR